MFEFVRQLFEQKNLLVFILIYFVQGFDCTFEKNHFSLFFEKLVGDDISKRIQGLVISSSFLLPWVVTVFLTPVIQRIGLYTVVLQIFIARVFLCIFSLTIVSNISSRLVLFKNDIFLQQGSYISGFLLLNRVLSEAVCRLCPLIISNLIDENNYIHSRRASVSATIIGASTVLGKGAQSVAPMLGYWLFRRQIALNLQSTVSLFKMTLLLVPLSCVTIQLLLWYNVFSLKGQYLKRIKEYTKENSLV